MVGEDGFLSAANELDANPLSDKKTSPERGGLVDATTGLHSLDFYCCSLAFGAWLVRVFLPFVSVVHHASSQ